MFCKCLMVFLAFVICLSHVAFDQKKVSYIGLGATQTVCGSLHVLRVGNNDYLIDIGSFYRSEAKNYPLPAQLGIARIKAVFITHAHADHIGRLPLLFEKGYKGPIYMTPVTFDIAKISLLSAIRYADFGEETFYYSRNNKSDNKPVYLDRFNYGRYQTKHVNKVFIKSKRSELNEKGFYMSQALVEHLKNELNQNLERQVRTVDFNKPLSIDGVTFEFLPTSHIPGSAMVKITVAGKKILFSGDIGSDRNPFLKRNEKLSQRFDYVFVEGTYSVTGNQSLNREQLYDADRKKFKKYLGNAIMNGDRVIIPAFVLDRTQQVLYEIKQGMEEGIIPRSTIVKAYSPTSEEITNLYSYYSRNRTRFGSYFSEKMFSNLFDIPNLRYNPSSFEVQHGEIAVMSSGMMSHAYSKEALQRYASDGRTHFVLVGYQDPEELGGQLLSSQGKMMIDNKEVTVNAKVFRTHAFGGHADIYQIQDLMSSCDPMKIFIVHLDAKNALALKNHYQSRFGTAEVIVPQFGRAYELFQF